MSDSDFWGGVGRTALDAVECVPGIGEFANGAEAAYHGYKAATTDNEEERGMEIAEAEWHGVNAIPVLHELMTPGHLLEIGNDVTQLQRRAMGAPAEKTPMGFEGMVNVVGAGMDALFKPSEEEIQRKYRQAGVTPYADL